MPYTKGKNVDDTLALYHKHLSQYQRIQIAVEVQHFLWTIPFGQPGFLYCEMSQWMWNTIVLVSIWFNQNWDKPLDNPVVNSYAQQAKGISDNNDLIIRAAVVCVTLQA